MSESLEKRTLEEALAQEPPGKTFELEIFIDNSARFKLADIKLFCPSQECERAQIFTPIDESFALYIQRMEHLVFQYMCRNCRQSYKAYAVMLFRENTAELPTFIKFGEWPPFGPPVSSKLITLIGPDRELFLKGRRAENQGFGIGAFAYYRRVVENQKNRLIDGIIKVAQAVGATGEMIQSLNQAKQETQFTKAVESIKEAIPDVLRIKQQNPLKLLHTALSQGLHEQTDEVCLSLAHDIRTILAEIAEGMAQALKDDAELNQSITRLLKVTSGNAQPPKSTSPQA